MFEDITIEWQGQTFTISGTSLLPLIAKIEDEVATVFEICQMYAKGKPKATMIAKALTIVLHYVGVTDVTAEQAFRAVSRGQAIGFLVALVNIMSPGDKPEAPTPDADADNSKKNLITA